MQRENDRDPRPRNPFVLATAVSAAVHTACLVLTLWWGTRAGWLERKSTHSEFIIVENRSIDGPPASPNAQPRNPKAAAPRTQRPRKLNLSPQPPDFAIGKSAPSPGGSAPALGRSATNSGSSNGQVDGYDTANQMSLDQEGEVYPFFEALWRKVNSVVTYPDDLVQQRIQGSVNIQLSVDPHGVAVGRIRSVRGNDPMLNTFATATLVHALSTQLPQANWMKSPKPILLVFQFDFNLFGPGGSGRAVEIAHFKNILNFRRDAYVDPALNQAIQKIVTRYIPPILPIPGGFFIDFIRAYQLVKNIAAPSPDADELRARRMEADQERWDGVIRRQ